MEYTIAQCASIFLILNYQSHFPLKIIYINCMRTFYHVSTNEIQIKRLMYHYRVIFSLFLYY